MLFDLQGSKKTAIKAIYLGLAILMAGGLVLFGIGSNTGSGGLADVLGSSSSADAAKDNVNKYAEQVEKNPKNVQAMQNLIAARYTLAADPENYNQDTGKFSQSGEDQLNLLKKNWAAYLKLTDNKPNVGTANYAVSGFLGLEDAKGASQAQQVVTEKQPTAANYLALMLYASYAGEQLVASGAKQRALELATKDEMKDVKDQIKEIEERIKDRNAEVQKQIQEQFAQQAQQATTGGTPSNPFGGVGGSAAGASTK